MFRGAVLAVLSASCYGLSPVFYKLGFKAGLTASDLLVSRFVVAAPLLFLYLFFTDRTLLRVTPGTLFRAVVVSCLFYAPQTASYAMSLRTVPAATTALILYFYPLAVTLLSVVLFGFRFTRVVVTALVVILAGCICVCADAFSRQADLAGVAWAVLTMACFSGYLLSLQRILKKDRPLTFTFYVFVTMAVLYGLFRSPTAMLGYDAKQLACALGIGLFPTALAVPFLYKAIERVGSAYVSIFSTFELVATGVSAWVFLGEPLSGLQMAGMAAIMAGVALPNLMVVRTARRMRVDRASD